MNCRCLCPGKGQAVLQVALGHAASHEWKGTLASQRHLSLTTKRRCKGAGVTHPGPEGPWPWMPGT